ncbi:MAG TPA: FtsX-like permease family protein [Puia sp.]|nr:FtsX-like permease family protein [Puia sp.]
MKYKDPGFQDWGSTFPYTYVILRPGVSVTAFNQKLVNYLKRKTNNQILYRTPFITKFSEAYLYGRYEDGKQVGGRIEYVRLFSIIAGVILLIACINFMNLSTAKAAGRAKEVGIKKVLGAGRFTLVLQYFGESLLMAFASLLVAILLVALVLPAFNGITGKQLTLDHPGFGLILWTMVILLVTGLLAGSYPALYLSGFKPAMVLKGKLKTATSELFVRKGLVVFQFALSAILIISVMVVYRQIHFIQTKKLGYDRGNVLAFYKEGKLSDPLQQESFLNAVRNIAGVAQASCIGHSLAGHSGGTYGVVWAGKDPNDRTEFEIMNVDYNFQHVLNIAMKEGRPYSRKYVADTNKIIFNEAAVKFMGMARPIGQKVTIWGKDFEIVGVMKDFNFQSLHEKIKPLFARLNPEDAYRFMLKIKPGKEAAAIDRLQQLYKQYNPGFPLNASFLDESYQRLYAAENRVSVLSRCFAGLAILISCLGLFGLAAFNIQRRSREIGIRKVLGASVGGVVLLLSRDYLKLIGFSMLIAFPLALWMTGNWLQSFVYHIRRGWSVFLLAGFLVILLTFLTISFQSIKAALVNPSRSLKSE